LRLLYGYWITDYFLRLCFFPVPSEREVVNKERLSGSYRLSAYYISKTFSELPLCLVLPSLSTIIFYWLAGLNGFNNAWAFFGTWFVMIGTTIATQSLGKC